MFKDNKYTKTYFALIEKAKTRNVDDSEYYERHHIIPGSLGGSDSPDNMVTLTAREHFICHMLLTKMTDGADYKKMVHAFWLMCNYRSGNQERDYKINSVMYESLKKRRSDILTGIPMPQETRAKISKTMKGVKKNTFSEEHKKKLSEAFKGRTAWNKGKKGLYTASEEAKQKMRDTKRNWKLSDSAKQKLSIARQNKINCFDKEVMEKVYITLDEFRAQDKYITYNSNEYKQNYKDIMNGQANSV